MVLCTLIILAFANSSLKGGGNNESTKADIAVNLALKFTGFDEFLGNKDVLTPLEVIFDDDRIPFLSDKYYGKEVWRVDFNSIKLYPDNMPKSKEIPVREFQVYVDPDNGKLLKIFSPLCDTDSTKEYLSKIPNELAEKQLSGIFEEFIDFEIAGDHVSLKDVINSLYFPEAKEITAQLLKVVLRGDTTAVWSVTYCGITPLRNHEDASGYYESYTRIEYSAQTGELLRRTTIPAMELLDNK